MTKLLEGIVDAAPDYANELRDAQQEITRLKRSIDEGWVLMNQKDAEIDKLKRIINTLRTPLAPLHKALRVIFGEIDLAGIDSEVPKAPGAGPSVSAGPQKSAIWDTWKAKLGGKKADVIDALLQHGELSVEQLCVITHTPRKQTIYDTMNALKKLQLTDSDGSGRYKLKQI